MLLDPIRLAQDIRGQTKGPSGVQRGSVGRKINTVSPTVLRAKGFRLFFFSREESRMHVHVQSERGEAKFWLEPQIELAQSYGLPPADVNEAHRLIQENEDVIRRAWNDHFGG